MIDWSLYPRLIGIWMLHGVRVHFQVSILSVVSLISLGGLCFRTQWGLAICLSCSTMFIPKRDIAYKSADLQSQNARDMEIMSDMCFAGLKRSEVLFLIDIWDL